MLVTLLIGVGMQAWKDADTALVIGVLLAGGAAYFALGLRIRRAGRILSAQRQDR